MEHLELRDRQGWAEALFGRSTLPDKRLKSRVMCYASAQMGAPAGSTAAVCETSAEREGAYRLLENRRVRAEDILEGPVQHCVERCLRLRRVLAIQDSSSVSVKDSELRESLKESGSATGFQTHTTLAVDPERGAPLGILDHMHWIREPEVLRRKARRERAQDSTAAGSTRDKESARWQATAARVHKRFTDLGAGGAGVEVVTVADREADIYELLADHTERGQGYVIRAKHARQVEAQDPSLGDIYAAVAAAPVLARRDVAVMQRGGQKAVAGQRARAARPAATVPTEVRACRITVKRPASCARGLRADIELSVVEVRTTGSAGPAVSAGSATATATEQAGDAAEAKPPVPSLHWVLLCSAPIETEADALQAVRDYECRWLIEELFKAWKTGCRLEERPFHTSEAVQRMMALLLPIAVLMLELRALKDLGPEATTAKRGQAEGKGKAKANATKAASDPAAGPDASVLLETDQWQCLWLHTERGKALPKHPPSCRWAYFAIAKLGGRVRLQTHWARRLGHHVARMVQTRRLRHRISPRFAAKTRRGRDVITSQALKAKRDEDCWVINTCLREG